MPEDMKLTQEPELDMELDPEYWLEPPQDMMQLLLVLWIALMLITLPLWLVLGVVLGVVVGLVVVARALVQLIQGQSLSTNWLYRLFPENRHSHLQQSQSRSTNRLYCIFPEDWRGELEARLQRLRKAQKPEWVIRREAIKCFLELLWAAIRIKWENLWLPKSKGVDK
jgi:hypothetical protein